MKVLLERGVWLAEGEGDPPTTGSERYAKKFRDVFEAARALCEARKYRPFRSAMIEEDAET